MKRPAGNTVLVTLFLQTLMSFLGRRYRRSPAMIYYGYRAALGGQSYTSPFQDSNLIFDNYHMRTEVFGRNRDEISFLCRLGNKLFGHETSFRWKPNSVAK